MIKKGDVFIFDSVKKCPVCQLALVEKNVDGQKFKECFKGHRFLVKEQKIIYGKDEPEK